MSLALGLVLGLGAGCLFATLLSRTLIHALEAEAEELRGFIHRQDFTARASEIVQQLKREAAGEGR